MIQTYYDREREDGVILYRTCSDDDLMIRKDGTDELYSEAIDVGANGNTYSETDIPINEAAEPTVEDILEMLCDLGVDLNDED